MIGALFYLQFHSLKNRLMMRFKRLRQPKYFLGGIVGLCYFYFYFFRHLFRARGTTAGLAAASGPDLVLYESLGAFALFLFIFFAWIIPHQRAALAFTEAEVAFLFPAPISRRGLIHFKLVRSQTAIFFTTLLLTLVTNRFGGRSWTHAAGWWLILSIVNLHLLGSSFARTFLLDHGISNWQRRVGALAIVAAGAVAVVLWARRTMPAFDPAGMENLTALKNYAQQLLSSGPAPMLLYPFRLVIRPYLAPNASAFLQAAAPALLLLLLHYVWVIRSNVAFEEASVEASRKLAEKVVAIRSGNWQSSRVKPKKRRAPFNLRPIGPAPVAVMWKNLIHAGQAFSFRLWIILAATAAGASFGLGQTFGTAGWAPALGMVAGMLVLWSMFFGPQFLRQDFRQDLACADILKMYPMRGWQTVLGELLAPAVILTGVQWLLLLVAAVLLLQGQGLFTHAITLGVTTGAAILLPLLNMLTLQIPNAAVLLFPAWFQVSREGSQGIEVTGQRLILFLGQLLVLAVALLLPAVLFAIVFIMARYLVGPALAIPVASIAAALLLAVENVIGLMLLGHVFERLDLSAEHGA